uniref:Uncharacterized protein n=1 Tax=Meloidogyne enterolobii TaxID=390850 RepID=A0A6V7U5L3_MELEN|nr:unnamed protein product [Meloidogyne enterolobii]
MFNTYVRSILEFGSPIWNPHFQKDINKIEKIQNNFLKMIYYRQHPSSTISRDFNNTISYSELLNKYQNKVRISRQCYHTLKSIVAFCTFIFIVLRFSFYLY